MGHVKDKLKMAMTEQLHKQFESVIPESVSVVIENTEVVEKMPKACCDFKFKIDPNARVLGRTIIPIQFFDCDQKLIDDRGLAIRVKARSEYVRSVRHIQKGAFLTSQNVQVVQLPMYGKPYNALHQLVDVKGTRAVNFVSEGTILTHYMVRPKPVVIKNQWVDVIYGSQDIQLKFRGQVLDDGIRDEKVRVEMRLGDKKIIKGKVLDEKTVLISR